MESNEPKNEEEKSLDPSPVPAPVEVPDPIPVPVTEKEESDVEEMERDSEESDQSGSGSGDSSEGSESDEASELDEEYVRRRLTCLEQMAELEKQYVELYDIIINERLNQISLKLTEIKCGEASEYLQPLADLEENMRIRSEVAGVLRQYRLKNLDNQYDAEELTAKQNFENEKELLYDSIEEELKEKIKHLEEDRNNVDLNADLWMVERGLGKSGKINKDKKHITHLKGGIHRDLESNSRRKPSQSPDRILFIC
ncbi:Breast cancer metastasis-suppressor 1-like protein [Sarracenia purpurea var. burkii]